MPELPEVETTRRGISPYLEGNKITSAIFREKRLRWPVSRRLANNIKNQPVLEVSRRGKYIIIWLEKGAVIIHLGMSGSLRIVKIDTPPEIHEHYDLVLNSGYILRYKDPRRFGSIHWSNKNPLSHKLLKNLGPEPLSEQFTGEYLYLKSRNKTLKIKSLIMNSNVVPGVGNIYANEALFHGKIRPGIAAGRISARRFQQLTLSIKKILTIAIEQGGTTLRDFVNSEGRPGYFQQRLYVYGRAGKPCRICKTKIKSVMQNQRATYYCPNCQC